MFFGKFLRGLFGAGIGLAITPFVAYSGALGLLVLGSLDNAQVLNFLGIEKASDILGLFQYGAIPTDKQNIAILFIAIQSLFAVCGFVWGFSEGYSGVSAKKELDGKIRKLVEVIERNHNIHWIMDEDSNGSYYLSGTGEDYGHVGNFDTLEDAYKCVVIRDRDKEMNVGAPVPKVRFEEPNQNE
ncbi:MAG: hypothetical protein OXF24_03865 [Hyphomicrobiales bacterium]|nr:hypothetical protein [Hyphomicrobiales bacterium]MCY4048704.1 hypothetical protein [Hyphomicrobiales bacterium]MCY4053450.1 hypothetical protein [Hyphomicrobiales bacterium]